VFQKPISGLLSDLSADGVFGLLGFLEELRHLLEGRVGLLLFSFGILNILEEQPVSLIIDLLSGSLRIGFDVFLKSPKPIYLLS
jgi:hypothetical protein